MASNRFISSSIASFKESMDASNADMSAVMDAKFALVELSWSYESVGAGINIIFKASSELI